jgi:putative endonuclease
MRRNREEAEKHGHRAEVIALWFLRFKGYRLLQQRFKTPMGEVDLIMRRGDTTVYVEVKARKTVDECVEAVSPYQIRRISQAAALYASRDATAARGFTRFDIVAIPSTLWPTHIQNAFEGR